MLFGSLGMAMRYVLGLQKEIQTLEELCGILELIEGEIQYGKASLPECFLKVGARRRTRLGSIFEKLGQNTITSSEIPLREAMEAELREELGDFLTREEYCIFFDFASPGGFAGDELQRKVLERSRHRMEELLEQRRKEFQGKRKVAISMGLTGGLFLILFLW